MAELIILVGLPASGKSHWAQENYGDKDDYKIMSSDSIREELFGDESIQEDNPRVFGWMRKRTVSNLKDGINVVYDATNISRKRRVAIMNESPKGTTFSCVYFDTHPDDILKRNNKRNRQVPFKTIFNMYRNMQIPVKGEGFQSITIEKGRPNKPADLGFANDLMENLYSCDELFYLLSRYNQVFSDIEDQPQDNSHHSFSVSRHTWHVYQNMLNNKEYGNDIDMIMASILHDTGKAYSKSFYNHKGEIKKYASFHKHENISRQLAYDLHEELPVFDVELVSTLCQFHMRLYDTTPSNLDKLKKLVGEDVYKRLLALNECDRNAK